MLHICALPDQVGEDFVVQHTLPNDVSWKEAIAAIPLLALVKAARDMMEPPSSTSKEWMKPFWDACSALGFDPAAHAALMDSESD